MVAETAFLTKEVEGIAKKRLGDSFKGATVVPAWTLDGDEFLLITIALTQQVDYAKLEDVLERVEDSLSELDNRSSDVRFLEAA